MNLVVKYGFLAVLLFITAAGFSQSDSTVTIDTLASDIEIEADSASKSLGTLEKSPKRAALLSAIAPGTGQIYNRKYWKLPIVYATVGGSIASIVYNRIQYTKYKNYYLMDVDVEDGEVSEFYEEYIETSTQEKITNAEQEAATQHLAWAEYSYLAFAAFYVLQIVDATVDAHLSSFDVGPDLSLNWSPTIQLTAQNRPVQGISINLTF